MFKILATTLALLLMTAPVGAAVSQGGPTPPASIHPIATEVDCGPDAMNNREVKEYALSILPDVQVAFENDDLIVLTAPSQPINLAINFIDGCTPTDGSATHEIAKAPVS